MRKEKKGENCVRRGVNASASGERLNQLRNFRRRVEKGNGIRDYFEWPIMRKVAEV